MKKLIDDRLRDVKNDKVVRMQDDYLSHHINSKTQLAIASALIALSFFQLHILVVACLFIGITFLFLFQVVYFLSIVEALYVKNVNPITTGFILVGDKLYDWIFYKVINHHIKKKQYRH